MSTSNKLRCDLLSPDRRTISIRKAITLLWEHKNEKNIISEAIDIIWLVFNVKYVFLW